MEQIPDIFLLDLYSQMEYAIFMPHLNETKTERVQIRTDPYTKKKLQRAADYSHETVSNFVLSNSIAAAERVLAKHETKTLSKPDWEGFYNALLDPPRPNKKLQAAFKHYLKNKK